MSNDTTTSGFATSQVFVHDSTKAIVDSVMDGKKFPPTPEQRNLVETVAALVSMPRNQRHVVIATATAGAGKTATSIDIYHVLQALNTRSYSFVTFGRKASEELKSRGVDGRVVRTLNGLGFANLRKFAQSRGLELDLNVSKRQQTIMRDAPGGERLWGVRPIRTFVKNLIGYIKSEAIFGQHLNPNRLRDLADHYCLYLDWSADDTVDYNMTEAAAKEAAYAWAIGAMTVNNSIPKSGKWVIDFDDQIYLPLVHKVRCFRNDVLLVDEAQDTSISNKWLIAKCLSETGVLIMIGDDSQAIYGFRGVHMNNLNSLLNNSDFGKVHSCPLTSNFRSCPEIIAASQPYTSTPITAARTEAGSVSTVSLEDFAVTDLDPSVDTAILSRLRAPLVGHAIECLKNEIPFTASMDLKDLLYMVREVAGERKGHEYNGTISKVDFLPLLESYVFAKMEKLMDDDQQTAVDRLEDSYQIILTIARNLRDTDTVDDLLLLIETTERDINTKSKHGGGLHLLTIHGSKGLEWTRVYVQGFSDIGKRAENDWQEVEAKNLRFVATSRAKDEMIFLIGE